MGKVSFEFSVEKISFKFSGDIDTGQAVHRAMNHTLGSLLEAQNRVIDVTPHEPAVPAALPPTLPPRRKHRRRTAISIGDSAHQEPAAEGKGQSVAAKARRAYRPRSEGFTFQTYRLIREGFFSQPRSAEDLRSELSRRAYNFESNNVASQLNDFVRRGYLTRHRNADNRWEFKKGERNDFPGSDGGS